MTTCSLLATRYSLFRALPRPIRQIRFHESTEIAIEDARRVAHFVAGAEVFDELVRLEDVRADLRAEGDVLLLPLQLLLLLLPFLDLDLVEAGAEKAHGHVAVLVLAALVLARHDDAGREVRDADGRVG